MGKDLVEIKIKFNWYSIGLKSLELNQIAKAKKAMELESNKFPQIAIFI